MKNKPKHVFLNNQILVTSWPNSGSYEIGYPHNTSSLYFQSKKEVKQFISQLKKVMK